MGVGRPTPNPPMANRCYEVIMGRKVKHGSPAMSPKTEDPVDAMLRKAEKGQAQKSQYVDPAAGAKPTMDVPSAPAKEGTGFMERLRGRIKEASPK